VLQHGGEAGPLVDRIRAFHGVVAVFGDQLIPGSLGNASTAARWRLSVSLSSLTLVADEIRK
jgi:hypothetical protein